MSLKQARLSDSAQTYAESQALCRRMNAASRVAVPLSAAENADLLIVFMSQQRYDKMWIGFSDNAVEGLFRREYGESTYTNWAPGQPDNGNGPGGEDCTDMWSTGQWNDASCRQRLPCACVVPANLPLPQQHPQQAPPRVSTGTVPWVVNELNRRFRAGSATSNLVDAGLLIYQFDAFVDPNPDGRPWVPSRNSLVRWSSSDSVVSQCRLVPRDSTWPNVRNQIMI